MPLKLFFLLHTFSLQMWTSISVINLLRAGSRNVCAERRWVTVSFSFYRGSCACVFSRLGGITSRLCAALKKANIIHTVHDEQTLCAQIEEYEPKGESRPTKRTENCTQKGKKRRKRNRALQLLALLQANCHVHACRSQSAPAFHRLFSAEQWKGERWFIFKINILKTFHDTISFPRFSRCKTKAKLKRDREINAPACKQLPIAEPADREWN